MADAKRFVALDVFRGMTIALMILVNTPGSWAYVYAPLRHAKWHGLTPTDWVFPFFLFIVGSAMAFSLNKYSGKEKWRKLAERTATLFLLGLALNAFPFVRQDWDFSNLRVMGVLQRIGLCYGLAGVILHFWSQRLLRVHLVLLGGYTLCLLLGGSDPFSLEHNMVGRLDLWVFGSGHVWHGNGVPFDPEGLLSTLPSVSTVLMGFQFGRAIQGGSFQKDWLKFGLLCFCGGWLLHVWLPVNKQLWTPSYVLVTGGLAILFLQALIWLIDQRGYRRFFWLFEIFGTNSIFVFVASGLWVKILLRCSFNLNGETVNGYRYLFETAFFPFWSPLNASFLFALMHVTLWWLILFELNRRSIHIKI
ncbi:MAG: DUF1624 domain-containing protein [Acidobacteria bacterium]|nr:DUF1624 domain-containing protein [Acidobacteriota bacterium]